MSIDEVEEKFSMGQLVLMSVMQSISVEKQKEEMENNRRSGGKRPKNRGADKREKNINAFRML